jgi:hypothetical protein
LEKGATSIAKRGNSGMDKGKGKTRALSTPGEVRRTLEASAYHHAFIAMTVRTSDFQFHATPIQFLHSYMVAEH